MSDYVNEERLKNHLYELAKIGASEGNGITRISFSKEYEEAVEYVTGLMRNAGMKVYRDPIGNLIGNKEGKTKKLIVMGSHIDTVKQGGMFDGALGVLGAIEVMQSLYEEKVELEHTVEIVAFIDEECGGIGALVGSKAYATGTIPEALMQNLPRFSKTKEDVLNSKHDLSQADAYLELHIEQGGVLEAEKKSVGVVEAIVAIKQCIVTINGKANHAGTTPMYLRDDAMEKTGKFLSKFYYLVRNYQDMVGTVGCLEVDPGSSNVIPGRIKLSLDLRSPKESDLSLLVEDIKAILEAEEAQVDEVNFMKATIMDPKIKQAVADSCRELGIKYKYMYSGAGHDAMNVNASLATGMIFVPSVGGISHSPKEYTSIHDCVKGTVVLKNTLLKLDKGGV